MVNGITITGTPAQVANATRTLAMAFKGATLAEVLTIIRKQQLATVVNGQLGEISNGKI